MLTGVTGFGPLGMDKPERATPGLQNRDDYRVVSYSEKGTRDGLTAGCRTPARE